MKINFSAPLLGLDGQPFMEAGKELTLANVCVAALLQTYADEASLSGEEKYNRYALASRVHPGGESDASAEEISKIKAMIARLFGPSVVGPAFNLLESKPTKLSSVTKSSK